MKKLMIAAAAAMLGIAANAANCNWSTDWVFAKGLDDATYSGDANFVGKYWLITSADFSSVSVNADGVISGASAYFNAGGATGVALDQADGLANEITGLTAADNGTQLALVLFYDDGGDKYWGMSSNLGDTAITGIVDPDPGAGISGSDAAPIRFENSFDGEYHATGAMTKIGNVPEPTSGLLLLLGVAGLALKRRRA